MKKLLAGLATLCALGIAAEWRPKTAAAQMQTQTREFLPLQLEEQIPVPSVAGRLDHFTADVKRKRLFVSGLGNNTVEVINVFAGRVVHSVKGLAQPQGPLYVPAVDKLYVANAEDGRSESMTVRPTRCERRSTLEKTRTTCGTMKPQKWFSLDSERMTAGSR